MFGSRGEKKPSQASFLYEKDRLALTSLVLEMGTKAGEAFRDAVRAIETRDNDLANRVLEGDEVIDELEVDAELECLRSIGMRQPLGEDLRFAFSVLKIVTDLERIGDQVGHVARAVLDSDASSARRPHATLLHLARLARTNTARAIEAFSALDVALALQVVQADAEVNREYQGSMRQLLTYIMEDPRTTSSALQLAWTARALERIGDHAKNIAEYVIYMVHGEDVRHISAEERERRLAEPAASSP